jgi:predicted DNA-binding ribbon-helix-helix protein
MDGMNCVIEGVSKGEKEKEQWFLKEKLNKTAHFYTLEVELIFLSISLATIKKETGLDFIFIDDFERFIPQVSSELKVKILRGLAEELDVAIFVLANVMDESDEPRINCNTVNGDLFAAADKVFGVCRKDFYATIDEIAENKIVQGESLLCVVKNDRGKRIAVTVYINYLSKEFQELPF